MEDVSPKLLKELQTAFDEQYAKNKTIQALENKTLVDYKDAHRYSVEVGKTLERVFKTRLSSDVLPDGKLYYNIAEKVLRPLFENNHKLVVNFSAEAQEIINYKEKIGLRVIKPKFNEDKFHGIIDRLADTDLYDDISWILGDPVVNFTETIVDETIKENAEFHNKAGLKPQIIRTSTGKCCDWCDNLTGVYDYPNVPDDVYARHENCRCITEYISGNTSQDVWTKKIRYK